MDNANSRLLAGDSNATLAYDQELKPYHTLIGRTVIQDRTSKHRDHIDSEPLYSILDVGCGTGNSLRVIEESGDSYDICVADIDSNCIGICEQRINVRTSHLITQTTDLVDRLDEEFDAVVYSHVLQYEYSPRSCLQALVSFAKPGGMVVLAVSNGMTFTKFLNTLLRKKYSAGFYSWDRNSLTNLLETLDGATIESVVLDYVPLPFVYKTRIGQVMGRIIKPLFPWLAFSIIVTLRRDLA